MGSSPTSATNTTQPMKIEENVLLAPYTTFNIGGPARYFAAVNSEQELGEALNYAQEKNLRILVLGSGSNILVSDEGFNGLVVKNQILGFEYQEHETGALCTAGGGEDWDGFVAKCVDRDLSGLELLSGIPGTVGAAPVQNIGAYGTSIDRMVQTVRAYDFTTKTFVSFSREQCCFSYRSSVFNKENVGRYIITRVTIALSKEKPSCPSYSDLAQKFEKGVQSSAAEIRKAVIEARAAKGMVILPTYESFKSAGSFFKNPIISSEQFERLPPLDCQAPWNWALGDGRVKIAAACLIQQAGFLKGYRVGSVGISPRHTLALINYNGATAQEVKNFAFDISRTVQEKFSITLEPEVQYIGK